MAKEGLGGERLDIFKSIEAMIVAVENGQIVDTGNLDRYRAIIAENPELLAMLKLFEKYRPKDHRYHLYEKMIILTYINQYDMLKLTDKLALKYRVRLVDEYLGLIPGGCLIAQGDEATRKASGVILKEFADRQKGLTVVLNAEMKMPGAKPYYSNLVLENRFETFEDYLGQMRSRYRKQFVKKIKKGSRIKVCRLDNSAFSEEHYELYRHVLERSPLLEDAPVPIEYFREFQAAELFEFRDSRGNLLAFEQVLIIGDQLYSLFLGFNRDPKDDSAAEVSSVDLYYFTAFYFIRYGIEKGVRQLVFSLGSEDAKSILGCTEELRYMYIASSNPLVKAGIALFGGGINLRKELPQHRVFKDEAGDEPC